MNRLWLFRIVSVLLADLSRQRILSVTNAFHDCVQSRKRARDNGRFHHRQHSRVRDHLEEEEGKEGVETVPFVSSSSSSSCRDGICVGMTNGPHQGGNASYPLAWNGTAGTRLESYMSVPEYPSGLQTENDFSKITYYIWTDIFFGDESLGRMNQLVPQLILGSALDGSTGPPSFEPEWKQIHTRWSFGAHYFFEVWNPATNLTDAHAAYGELVPVVPGEILLTTFELSLPQDSSAHSPVWTLTMSVVGDPSRTSVLKVPQPYMGVGKDWSPRPSTSWLEPNFRNLCINACWEFYGASDAQKLPTSGAEYRMKIEQPLEKKDQKPLGNANARLKTETNLRHSGIETLNPIFEPPNSLDIWESKGYYDFTTWEQDEGNGMCPSCKVSEVHTQQIQEVFVEINISSSSSAAK